MLETENILRNGQSFLIRVIETETMIKVRMLLSLQTKAELLALL